MTGPGPNGAAAPTRRWRPAEGRHATARLPHEALAAFRTKVSARRGVYLALSAQVERRLREAYARKFETGQVTQSSIAASGSGLGRGIARTWDEQGVETESLVRLCPSTVPMHRAG